MISVLVLFANVGRKSPWGTIWHVDAVFLLNEPLVDALTCIKVAADTWRSVTVLSVYRPPQVLMPATLLRQGSGVCLSVATRTGIQGKSAGLPRVHVTWAVVTSNALFSVLCRGHRVWCLNLQDYGRVMSMDFISPFFVFLVPREPYRDSLNNQTMT